MQTIKIIKSDRSIKNKSFFMKYCAFFIAIIFFSSCEEVIEVELNEADQRIVIEGNIETDNQKVIVQITKSGSFYQTNDFEKITGADVIISKEGGEQFELLETSEGIYELENFESAIGDVFKLEIIDSEDNIYEAETTVPRVIDLIELTFEKIQGIGGEFYRVNCFLEDPKDEKNFYRIKYYKNGVLNTDDTRIFEDLTFDGELIDVPLFVAEAEAGDVIEVELISFDEDSYDYFVQIEDVSDAGFANSVPYNPQGNITNDALGYFGAKGISRDTIILE